MKNSKQDQYKKAVGHYLSPKRQDFVKDKWENPFSYKVIGTAIQNMAQQELPETIRVVDFGCGIGGGFSLMQNSLKIAGLSTTIELRYLGLDSSPNMIHVAEQKWIDSDNATFQVSDFRTDTPEQPTDIYLSCGVPYSHLTQTETRQTLGNLFRVIKRNKMRSLIVVDVLGKYSIEWVSKWKESRWPYRMSFVADRQEQEPMMMTCYYAPELISMIREVAELQKCNISSVECFDRSIMVGRHTSTREYNPSIPPYREKVNSLYEANQSTDFAELLLSNSVPKAPAPIESFFQDFSQQWNQLISIAATCAGDQLSYLDQEISLKDCSFDLASQLRQELESLQDSNSNEHFRTNIIEPILAKYLSRLEETQQRGLGASHTLIALVYVDASH